MLDILNNALSKYEELSPVTKNESKALRFKARRVWKRLILEPEEVRELRSRLTSHVSLLDAFNGQVTLYDISLLSFFAVWR